MSTSSPTCHRRQSASTLASFALIAVLASLAPLALAQASNPDSTIATDVVENGCFRLDKSYKFCGAWDGAYLDIDNYPPNFTFQNTPNTAAALSIFWANAPSGQIGKVFNERFAQWVRGNPATITAGGKSVPTYPNFMMGQNMGCTGYSGHLRRYLVSMTCMQLVDGASAKCKAVAQSRGFKPVGLCKPVCEASTRSLSAMFSNTTMCPGTSSLRNGHVSSFQNLCDRHPAFSGTSATTECLSIEEIEKDTCGYQERGPICNASTCPAGPATEFCKGALNSGNTPSSGLPATDPNATNPDANANKQGATEEASSGLSAVAIAAIGIGSVLVVGAIGALFFVRRRSAAAAAAAKANNRGSRDSWPPQKPVMTNLDSAPYDSSAPVASSGHSSGKAPLSPRSFDNHPPQQGPPAYPMQNMQQQQQQPTSPMFGNNSPMSPYAPHQQQQPYGAPPGSNPASAVGMNQQGYPQHQQQPQQQHQYGNMPPGSNSGSAVGMNNHQGYHQQPQQFDRGMPAPAIPPMPADQPQSSQLTSKANKRVSSMMVVQQHQEATLGRDGEFGNGTMTEDDFMAEFEGEQYKASRNYDPGMSDEMELVVGDMISVTSKYDDGWAYGLNLSTGQLGVFPLNFAEPVGDERANPVAVPTRQSMYGNSDRLSQYRKSVKLDVAIDDAPLDVDFSKGPGSNVGAKQQQDADPRQTAVPADPSSISALMAVLEKISADERGGEIAPELKDKKKRETIEYKVARLPPDVRDSIVSSATNDHHNSRFSFSALMNVLDDPQLQHHQSVYLDKKAGSRDTLYSTYTYYEEMDSDARSGSPAQPPLPSSQGYSSAYAHHQGGQHATQRPLSTLSDLDRWDQRLEHDSEEMNRELTKLRQQEAQQGHKTQSPRY